MKTLAEFLFNPISFIMYMYVGLWIWETLAPARKLPGKKNWKIKGLLFFFFNFALATVVPLFTDQYLAVFQLFDVVYANPLLSAFVGIFIYQGLLYAWHRLMHSSNALWRVFHQMHHSPERLDIPSAFYTSPLDTIGFTILASVSFVLILGLSPQAATIAMLSLTFLSLFQHANIKTPVWLGYIIQRPESHSLHHSRGVHKYNYSDFPIYDIFFGTFKNPKEFSAKTGFYDGGSDKIVDMLMFKDIVKSEETIKLEENGSTQHAL